MSLPEPTSVAPHSRSRRLRPAAVTALAVAALGLAGCAHYETLEPYTPAAGAQTTAPGVMVRNLMVLDNGGSMQLAGSLIASSEDSLTSVSGNALTADGGQGGTLGIKSSTLQLPNGSPVDLSQQKITVTGATAGATTRLTLNFAKAGQLTMTVPVVDAKANDISTASPSAQNAG